jgi:hypothetical protein
MAIDGGRPCILADDTGEDLDEGALPCAVGAKQGMDLARFDREVDGPQRNHGAIALGYAFG